jgi:RNA polymerase sigma-70 factor (ECF subfamily)
VHTSSAAPAAEPESKPIESGHCSRAPEDALSLAARRDFQFLWRTLRRLGVRPDAAVDDAVQQVFEVAVKKRAQIEAGRERAYLFKTALLVAADARRSQRRVSARLTPTGELSDTGPDPEQAVDVAQKRALLDTILDGMTDDLRTVFVLFELERLATEEIAQLTGLPPGTVASRLRRGREHFREQTKRIQARANFRGGL